MIDPVEFPLRAHRLSGATTWSTHIQRGRSGYEVRTAEWQDSLRRFNAALGVKRLEDQQTLEEWFMVCQGPAIGFLLRDWKDYRVTRSPLRGLMSSVGGSQTLFQMERLYTNGFRSIRRRITRPQAGTVRLYDAAGNAINAGYTVDWNTGRVSTTSAYVTPPNWDGQFYVPVRFQEDEIPWDLIRYGIESGKGVGELPEIVLVEVRE